MLWAHDLHRKNFVFLLVFSLSSLKKISTPPPNPIYTPPPKNARDLRLKTFFPHAITPKESARDLRQKTLFSALDLRFPPPLIAAGASSSGKPLVPRCASAIPDRLRHKSRQQVYQELEDKVWASAHWTKGPPEGRGT